MPKIFPTLIILYAVVLGIVILFDTLPAFAQDNNTLADTMAGDAKVLSRAEKIEPAKDTAKKAAEDTQVPGDIPPDSDEAPSDTASKITEKIAGEGSLREDLRAARDILISGSNEEPFLRGMIYPLFQPVFILLLFGFGLWSGQMHDRLNAVWLMPMSVLVFIVGGAFVGVYVPEWRPHIPFLSGENMSDHEPMAVISVLALLILGVFVMIPFVQLPFIGVIFAAFVAALLGFSPVGGLSSTDPNIILFWLGCGVTGLIASIFGIGMENFLRTFNLGIVTRLLGVMLVLSGLIGAVLLF